MCWGGDADLKPVGPGGWKRERKAQRGEAEWRPRGNFCWERLQERLIIPCICVLLVFKRHRFSCVIQVVVFVLRKYR